MNGIDIAVIVCVSVLVAALAAYFIIRKLRHKDSGCGGCCSECGMCARAVTETSRAKADSTRDAKPEIDCDCSDSVARNDIAD